MAPKRIQFTPMDEVRTMLDLGKQITGLSEREAVEAAICTWAWMRAETEKGVAFQAVMPDGTVRSLRIL
jgi:hypothetical protein